MVRSEQSEDFLLLSLATVALVLEVLYLFWLLRVVDLPVPLYWRDAMDAAATKTTSVGSLVEKRLSVLSRSKSSLTWLPMASGDTVYSQDTLMTGASSSGIVQLSDGSRVELGPNSLIHFPSNAAGAAFVEMELNRGKVRLLSAGNRQKVRLRTRSIVIQPETEIVLVAEPTTAKVSVELVKGEAVMPTMTAEETFSSGSDTQTKSETLAEQAPAVPAEEVRIKAGDSLQLATNGQVKVGPTLLKVVPTTPSAGVKLFARSLPMGLRFTWTGEAAKAIELSTDEKFANSRFVEVAPTADGLAARGAVGVGRHYWRLVDGKRRSTSYSFDVIEFPKYAPKEPDRTTLKESRKVVLRWKAIPLAEGYELEIARDSDFKKVVFSRRTQDTAVEWTADAPGDFYWRVTAGTAGIDRWPSSEAQHFRVRAQIAAPKPKGAKVLQPKKPQKEERKAPQGSRMKLLYYLALFATSDAFAEDKLRMEFNWETVPGAKRYLLQVSTTPKFGRKPMEFRLGEAHALVDLPAAPEYFWRVAGIDEDGDLGKFSETQKMDARHAILPRVVEAPPTPNEEPKPVERELASRRNLPEVPPPPTHVTQLKLGYGGGWAMQRGSSGIARIESSGVAWNSFKAAALLERGDWTAELKAGFQPWYLRSENPEIAAFQPTINVKRWDFSVLAREKTSAWYGGPRFRFEGELQRTGPETVSLDSLAYIAAVVGRQWNFGEAGDVTKGLSLRSQLELAPIGPRKGVSMDFTGAYAFGRYFTDFVPILEFSLYPYYRHNSINGHPEWTVEASTWLWVAWKLDVPAPAVALTTSPTSPGSQAH